MMKRSVYLCLLRLHPRWFRQRFGDEMLCIFDQAAANGRAGAFFRDAAVSLARQWLLRSEPPAHTPLAANGVPTFRLCDDSGPRTMALIHGGILSLAVFAGLTLLVAYGGSARSLLLLGSRHPSHSHLLPAHTSAPAAPLSTEVAISPDNAIRSTDLVREFVVGYFRTIRALDAMDTNHDHVISAAEMRAAPAVLRKLDANGDGKLSASECEARAGRAHALWDSRKARRFMALHPVLAALDANHDGVISAREIANAPAALGSLDRNYDGKLTPHEVLPDPVAYFATQFRSVLDERGEHRVIQALFQAADRNKDGIVTDQELMDEIRLRADLDGDGTVTWEEILLWLRRSQH